MFDLQDSGACPALPRALLFACTLAFAAPSALAQAGAAPALERLTLASASAMLTEANRPMRIARRALEGATADIRRADVAPNPTVSAFVQNTAQGRYTAPEADRIFRVEQTLERGRKRELRVDTARAAESAARHDLADVTRQQRLALAQTYFDLVAAQRIADIATDNAQGYVRLVSAAEIRVKSGDLAAIDLARLRVESIRAANDARAADAAREQAQFSLASVLSAESLARSVRASDDFPALATPPDTDSASPAFRRAVDDAVTRRADARAALSRVESLDRARRLAQSQQTRDVTLGLQTERQIAYGGNVFGISASVPLLLNNDYSGDIARASADYEQAAEELERVRGVVRADAGRAASQLGAAYDRASRVTRTGLPEAIRAADAVEFAFGRGAATLTDLFDSRRQLAAVRAEAITALADYAKALANWREALAIEETP